MRIALLSSTQFGLRCLQDGIREIPEVSVAGILTTPRVIDISFSAGPLEIKTHAMFDEVAENLGCELAQFEGPATSANYLTHLERWKPDLILALGWYYLIPRSVRESARHGCAGVHASLLPKYRGCAPITWAIINGESETGVTLFYFTDEIDAGDVVAQRRITISPSDTCATLYAKAEQESAAILREMLPRIATGTAPRLQQDHSQATRFPARSPADGLIDWTWSTERIQNFIRAQTHPYPGAFFYTPDGRKVTVWDATVLDRPESQAA